MTEGLHVPAGAVHQHDRTSAGADGLAEFVEHRMHGGGADRGQDQSDASIPFGTDRPRVSQNIAGSVLHLPCRILW